jgi:membrane protein YqaA with SNARE-associated domain
MFEWVNNIFAWLVKETVELSVFAAAPLMILVGALDSSLLSIPEFNDYITVVRVAHNPTEVFYFPLFPAVGSVIGCLVLYAITNRGGQFVRKRFDSEKIEMVRQLYLKWGVFALAVPALLPPPMPFKIFVATAGVMGYPRNRFITIIMIARSIRYYAWGIAAYIWRDEVLNMLKWMEAHFAELLGGVIAFFVIFILARLIIIHFRHRSRTLKTESGASFSD